MKQLIGFFVLTLLLSSCESLVLRSAEQESFQLDSPQTGQSYEITVLLPPDYSESQSYPTVYLIDGHWHYPNVAADAKQLMEKDKIRDILLVGIAYAGINPKSLSGWGSISEIRIDDLTSVKNKEEDVLGGKAAAFRSFLKEDLIPEVEARYASAASERTLMGHSLGGYFGFWEMFTFPDSSLFVNIEAGSPALWWGDGHLMADELLLHEAGTSLPFNLHTTMGSLESVTWNTFFDEMEERLKAHQPAGLTAVYERYPKGHSANAEVGFKAGLEYFFSK